MPVEDGVSAVEQSGSVEEVDVVELVGLEGVEPVGFEAVDEVGVGGVGVVGTDDMVDREGGSGVEVLHSSGAGKGATCSWKLVSRSLCF